MAKNEVTFVSLEESIRAAALAKHRAKVTNTVERMLTEIGLINGAGEAVKVDEVWFAERPSSTGELRLLDKDKAVMTSNRIDLLGISMVQYSVEWLVDQMTEAAVHAKAKTVAETAVKQAADLMLADNFVTAMTNRVLEDAL